ncbi:hypothetical protein DFH06DRAFT_578270 [Mycena polygramma]|nr:hypothetical protein DFH06DRAFT_578270 [Mycena polygramma]
MITGAPFAIQALLHTRAVMARTASPPTIVSFVLCYTIHTYSKTWTFPTVLTLFTSLCGVALESNKRTVVSAVFGGLCTINPLSGRLWQVPSFSLQYFSGCNTLLVSGLLAPWSIHSLCLKFQKINTFVRRTLIPNPA